MIPLLLFLASLAVDRKLGLDQIAWEREILCWESGYCQPRVVNLGFWDPRPSDAEWERSPRAPEPKTAP